MKNQSIRVIVFQEEDGSFAAQCLEYDICTQAATQQELEKRLEHQIEVERALGRQSNGQDFGDLGPAPDVFRNMWDSGKSFSETESATLRVA